jgi:signal transduction histidine kinase/CheY-like chemotaxis protein/AraC-like DNA-binding protein
VHRFLLYILLFSSIRMVAQPFTGNLELENITFPDGSQLSYIYQSQQDSTGLIWFHFADGDSHFTYDGQELKPTDLAAPIFQSLDAPRTQYNQGKPWFLRSEDSLLIFDPSDFGVLETIPPINNHQGVPLPFSYYTFGETEQVVWVLTNITVDDNKPDWEYILRWESGGPPRIVDSVIVSWYYDHVLTREDHFFVKLKDRVIETGPKGRVREYRFPEGPDPVMPAIVKDEENTIWVIYSPDKTANQYGVYFLRQGAEAFERLPANRDFPQGDMPGTIFSDGKFIWHRGTPFRLSRLRVADGRVEDLTEEIRAQKYNFPFYNSPTLSLFRGRSGEVWITTRAGIVKMTLEEEVFHRVNLGSVVFDCPDDICTIRGITEGENGLVYLSHAKGIEVLDRSTGQLSTLKLDIPFQLQPVHGLVYAGGTLFWNEYAIDPTTGAFEKLVPVDDYDYISSTVDAAGEYVWIAVNNFPFRIFQYHVPSAQLTELQLGDDILTHLNAEIRQIHFSPTTRTLFLSVWLEGLLEINLDGTTKQVYDARDDEPRGFSNTMYGLHEDRQGRLWFGHGHEQGLSYLDLNSRTFNHSPYRSAPEVGPLKRVFQILPGSEANLWLVTEKGTMVLDTETGGLIRFPMFPTLNEMAFHRLPGLAAKDGQLLIGSTNGDLNSFTPQQLFRQAKLDESFPIALTRFERFQEGVDSLIALTTGLSNLQTIHLAHDDRYFNLEFFVPDFRRTENVLYTHWLEGYETDWSQPSPQNELRYENLPVGEYTLHIRGGISSGYYASSERQLRVVVHRAWYWRWYAILAYLLILGGVLYGLYRRQIRRQLERAETHRLKELDALKTRLYTNITHEFRTPLTVIMGMADQLPAEGNAPSLIKRNGRNLLRLVNQMLDLAKLESGAMQVAMYQADIITFLRYLLESFHSMAEEKGIELRFETEEPVLLMDFDEVKIQHIVNNLLSNALKFSQTGDQVSLLVRQEDEHLHLCVRDTGIGIAPEELGNVFDRFYQADSSSTRKAEGTGIGLTLTQELVTLLGGTISVESTIGEGTEFRVLLPISRTAPPAEKKGVLPLVDVPEPSEVMRIEPAQKGDPDKPLLLIIEDNRDVVTYIETLLRDDYRIEIAMNGAIGIERASTLIPDVIISDVMMPEKDGFEVCLSLKNDQRTSHIPIILLTAKAGEKDRLEGLRGGADAYLTKPFNKEELQIRLEKLVALRAALRDHYARPESWLASSDRPTLEDEFLQKLTRFVEEHLDDPKLDVHALCRAAHLSNTQVNRKLKALTGKTPSRFIRAIRLHKGRELLLTSHLTISEIAYEVGFSDPNYFSRSFSEEFGSAPSEVRN